VVWTKAAEKHLTEKWIAASDKDGVTRAANAIDKILSRDPYSFSESRADSSRIMFVPPMAVAFDVSPDDCLVTVWALWEC
jgi:hypothetical protein